LKVVFSHESWFVPVSTREMGTDTALVPDAGTASEPENVVPLSSRLEAAHPVGGVTTAMLMEVTVMGTFSGLWAVYHK
jgi:hypothetical protein